MKDKDLELSTRVSRTQWWNRSIDLVSLFMLWVKKGVKAFSLEAGLDIPILFVRTARR